MKKYLIPLVILLILSFIVAACGTSTPTTTPAATTPGATTPVTTTSKPTPTTTVPLVQPTTTAPPTGTGSKTYGGTLRFITAAAPSSPIGAVWESPFANASQQISFDTLFREMADGSLLPWLASYEVNADPKNPSYTLKLQKGVKFHDGTDFDAKALKWGIQKLIDAKLFASVTYFKSIDIVDDYTLYCPLTEWRNSNLPAMAKTQHWVVSPTAFEKNGLDWIRTHMVGTGPFVQTDYQRDVSLTGKRFDNYWVKGAPYPDQVQYLYVTDPLTQQALFKSGGAEVYDTNANARVASELAAAGFKIISQTAGAQALIPDSANADSPWSKLKVREAAEYAMDREAIARTFGYGYWKAAYQAPSPEAPAYVPTIAGRKYDTAKAKQLLTEAGYPNGFKTKLIAADTTNRDVLLAIQSYFSKVGIDASLDIVQASGLVAIQAGGWTNGVICVPFGFEGNIIPAMGFNFPPVRTGRYKNVAQFARYEELYKKVATTPTLEVAIEKEIVQEVYDFLMWIPIYYYPSLWATTPNVMDSGIGTRAPGGTTFWDTHTVWLKK